MPVKAMAAPRFMKPCLGERPGGCCAEAFRRSDHAEGDDNNRGSTAGDGEYATGCAVADSEGPATDE